MCTKSKRTLPFGRVFARWSSQRRSPRSQRAGQIADEPKEGRSRARQRAREVPRGPPCRWWSPGQRRSRQKENPTRFSSAEQPIFLNYRSVTRGFPSTFFFRWAGRPPPRPLAKFRRRNPPASWGPLLATPLQRGRKRTRVNGTRAAVRPPGPEKWSHRLGHPT